jgi:ATP-dependent helicase/nuclease subunit A
VNPIFDPGRSLVVVAGAGTGKTWHLVRRYLRLIATADPSGEPWASPDQVLAVTFTRAAAVEMRSRVLGAIALDPAAADPRDEVIWQMHHGGPPLDRVTLSQELAGAPIDTLHGLCARLLREFPELSGVDPDARPVEPGEDAVWRGLFLGRFLDEILDDPDHALHADAAALLLLRPLSEVRAELSEMLLQPHPPQEGWGDPAAVAALREGWLERQWAAVAAAIAPPAAALLQAIEAVRAAAPGEDDWTLRKDAEAVRDALSALQRGRQGVARAVEGLEKIWPSEGAGPVQDARARLWRALRSRAGAGSPLVPPLEDDLEHAALLARWARLGRAACERYAAFLQERALLRFDDLESRTLALLTHPSARRYLRGRFTHLLVDEFQDTNATQVQILDALAAACGGLTTFFVGDPKQSIYRFRGAEVEVFEAEIAARDPAEVAHLALTWRTSEDLNGLFNAFFPRLFLNTPPVGDRWGELDDRAAVPWEGDVRCARALDGVEGPPAELMLWQEGAKVAEEPERVAARVAALLAGTRLTLPDGSSRALRRADVAILLPKWRYADRFQAALEAWGIPSELAGGKGLLQLPEVRDLTNLLRMLGSWEDELAAAAVLRGPLFAISDAGLYALARGPGVMRRGPLSWGPWDAEARWPRPRPRSLRAVALRGRLDPAAATAGLRDALQEPEAVMRARLEGDAAALEAGREALAGLVKRAGRAHTGELLAEAISAFRLEAHWLAGPRGGRAVANAWRFVELVRGFEADGPDLEGLIAWVGGAAEPAPEGRLSGDADAVTITTVHGAQGLEWPVVFLAGLGQYRGGRGRTTWRDGRVPGVDPDDPQARLPRAARPTGGFQQRADPLEPLCEALVRPAEAAENKRLLYVGMTRAADLLVLSGTLKGWHGRNKDGRIKPLAWCRAEPEYVVAVLGLRPDPAGRLQADPQWARWVVQSPPLPALEGPAERAAPPRPPIEPALLRWRPGRRARTWNPSAGALPWRGARLSWSDPGPLPPPVALPEADPRLLGTLFHAVVERWTFRGPAPDALECARWVAPHVRDAEAHGPWLAACVALLAGGGLGGQLAAAAARRELFHEIDLDAFTGQGDRISGRLDLLWREGGRWWALDYKLTTKAIDPEGLAALQEEYGAQLRAYREALEAWRPGQVGRLGLWLAPAGRATWVEDWSGAPRPAQLGLFGGV